MGLNQRQKNYLDAVLSGAYVQKYFEELSAVEKFLARNAMEGKIKRFEIVEAVRKAWLTYLGEPGPE